MNCPKCNKKIAGNPSICPHCNTKIVKKNTFSSKGAVNQYIKTTDTDLVGGTVTKGNGVVAKLNKDNKKKKAIKPSTPHTNLGTKSKYLKEDNSHLVGGATTGNKGSMFKLKSKQKKKDNHYNTQKGSKSKILSEDNTDLVGGTVANNSFVKLEKKNKVKNLKPVERKDYVNYIDYKEAKEEQEDKIRSISHFKSLISVKNDDVSGNVVNPEDFNKAPKIESALVKKISEERDAIKKISLDKNKPQPMEVVQNTSPKVEVAAEVQVENVVPVNNTQVVVQPKKKNRSFNPEFNIFSYALVISLWIIAIVMLVGSSNNGFYFGQKQSFIATSSGDEFAEFEGVSKSGQTGGTSAEGFTSIVYDNQYLGQFTIRTEEDVYNLIISDSLKQKGSCPSSVRKIEEEIVDKYGITAVNLCEMNEDFADEISYVVKYIYDEFPEARNYLTNLTLANVGNDNSFIAAFMPIFTFSTSNSTTGYPVATKTQIILNAKYFLNNEKIKNSVSYGTKSGYFPSNATRSSTVAHEFGHYLSYIALLNYYETDKLNYVRANDTTILYDVYDDFNAGNFSRILLEEAFDEYVAETGSTESFYEFRASISQYAIAKDGNGLYIYDETIAEAFHDYYLNGSNAKPASLAIMEVLRSKL